MSPATTAVPVVKCACERNSCYAENKDRFHVLAVVNRKVGVVDDTSIISKNTQYVSLKRHWKNIHVKSIEQIEHLRDFIESIY